MKKIIILVICSVGFVFAADIIEGFRELKFGDNLTKLGKYNLTRESDDKKEKTYTKTNENLQIGNVKLKGIYYTFCNGKLCRIIGSFSDLANFDIFEKAFTRKYGAPSYERDKFTEKSIAYGDFKERVIFLSYDKFDNKGLFSYADGTLENQIENERAIDAAKGL